MKSHFVTAGGQKKAGEAKNKRGSSSSLSLTFFATVSRGLMLVGEGSTKNEFTRAQNCMRRRGPNPTSTGISFFDEELLL